MLVSTNREMVDSYINIHGMEKDKLSEVDIKEFEEKLNLMRPSYDYEKRKEIATRWAEEEICAWINNDRLKTIVLKEIKDKRNLTTPLKMRGFAVVTVEVNEEDLLRERIKEKSEETARAFAEEIKYMTWDKIVFLSLLFVSRFRVNFMRDIYEKMMDEHPGLHLIDQTKDLKQLQIMSKRIAFNPH